MAVYKKNADDLEVNYTYDVSGMRTSKTITDGTTTDTVEYVYEGGLLLQMRYNNMYLDFSYDANGAPVSLAYRSTATSNPVYYYYALNSRGDVIGLYNSAGNLTTKYSYDAYGKLLGVTNASGSPITAKYAPANLNPLRYRGYVYDNETGFYYLQSRYYDPTTCRFVNEDNYYDTGVGLTGLNMFAYCNNNPVNCVDYYGVWTFGLSVGVNATLIAGASVSIGIVFDDNGNFDVQWSYAVPTVNNTSYYGFVDIGMGAALQFTNVDSVDDLCGYSTVTGASGGAPWYIGVDAITTGRLAELEVNDDIDGVQIIGGYGYGFDVHVSDTYTNSCLRKNDANVTPANSYNANGYKPDSYNHRHTLNERRAGGLV